MEKDMLIISGLLPTNLIDLDNDQYLKEKSQLDKVFNIMLANFNNKITTISISEMKLFQQKCEKALLEKNIPVEILDLIEITVSTEGYSPKFKMKENDIFPLLSFVAKIDPLIRKHNYLITSGSCEQLTKFNKMLNDKKISLNDYEITELKSLIKELKQTPDVKAQLKDAAKIEEKIAQLKLEFNEKNSINNFNKMKI